MSAETPATVTGVSVQDDGIDRTTTITVTEGRQAGAWSAEVDSLPPAVRRELARWLDAAESLAGVDVGGGAGVAVGFTPGVSARGQAR